MFQVEDVTSTECWARGRSCDTLSLRSFHFIGTEKVMETYCHYTNTYLK